MSKQSVLCLFGHHTYDEVWQMLPPNTSVAPFSYATTCSVCSCCRKSLKCHNCAVYGCDVFEIVCEDSEYFECKVNNEISFRLAKTADQKRVLCFGFLEFKNEENR